METLAPTTVFDEVAPEKFINRHVVAERLDCDPSTLARMVREGRFLAPVMIGKMPKWREADVNAWITDQAKRAAAASKPAKRGR